MGEPGGGRTVSRDGAEPGASPTPFDGVGRSNVTRICSSFDGNRRWHDILTFPKRTSHGKHCRKRKESRCNHDCFTIQEDSSCFTSAHGRKLKQFHKVGECVNSVSRFGYDPQGNTQNVMFKHFFASNALMTATSLRLALLGASLAVAVPRIVLADPTPVPALPSQATF